MRKDLVSLSFLLLLSVSIGANLHFCAVRTVFADGTNPALRLPLEVYQVGGTQNPQGFSPQQIQNAYNLPSTGGNGTIAIILAYDDPFVQSDLNNFSSEYNLPAASFEEHKMISTIQYGALIDFWEASLDTQWAHAIAPNAKILYIEAGSWNLTNLLSALDYARNRSDVVSISMSWGFDEQQGPLSHYAPNGTWINVPFTNESLYDSYFTSPYNATFFAASGDQADNVSWPASSPNVVGVGGTILAFNADRSVASENVWNDTWGATGGGVSQYEPEPSYQASYGVQGLNGHRGVPDVSYASVPMNSSMGGFSVFTTISANEPGEWYAIGGTSAGTPQWAAINSLGLTASNSNLYKIAKSMSYPSCFRDITNGTNGNYNATSGYDLVTGLGSPLTTQFGAWINSINVYYSDASQNLTTLHDSYDYYANINFTWNQTGTSDVLLKVGAYDSATQLDWESLAYYDYINPGTNDTCLSFDEIGYPQPGNGTLNVTLSGWDGKAGTSFMAPWNETIKIVNSTNHSPNTPSFSSYQNPGINGTQYSYTVNATDPDGDNIQYLFNWGDGTGNTTLGWCASGVAGTANHTWTNAGTYNITAYVHDPNDAWNSHTITVTMNNSTGGGGGGCPYLYDWNGTDYIRDNNILPASENGNGTDTKDYYLLQQPLIPVLRGWQQSLYSLQIGEFETNLDYIDQVKLIAIDHSQGTSVAATQDGQIITYQNPATPLTCVDNYGNSELTQISTMNGNVSDLSTFFEGNRSDWLLMDFGRITGSTANLILRDDMKCQECIDVQVPNGIGGWQNVTVLNPRDFWSIEAVNMTAYIPQKGDFVIRLYWTQTHRLDFVGLDTSSPVQVQTYSASPKLAIHSTLGNVTSQLLYDDENCIELINGQQVTITFNLPNRAQGKTRDFIFYTDGYYYTIT